MNSPETFVYIVDDDPSFRRSMERLVRASGYAVEAFDSAHSFRANAVIRHPACLLLDVCLPDVDGLSFQKELGAKGSTLPVIFMTGHGTIPMGVQAMKNGAIDFLPKPFEKSDLFSAIEKALERDFLDTQKEAEHESISTRIETLTPREKEVLRWIITGKPNRQIAHALGTTEKTIKVHRSRVMKKIKVSSVAELVRLAEKVNISPAV
jgi:RNA polymerase sigma factor (sigma-70 family)